MEDDKKMDAGRSLEIISDAIKTSRREAGRSIGTMMTAWGVLGVATSVVVAWLWGATDDVRWNWLWAAAALAAYVHYLYMKRQEKRGHTADTFATQVIKWVWATFIGVGGCAVMFGFDFIYNEPAAAHLQVYPAMILLLCLASGVTGMVTSNGAGSGCAVMAVYWAKAAAEEGDSEQAVCMALACLFALLLPGLIMKYRTRKHYGERETE